MRRIPSILCLLALAVACGEYGGPSVARDVYALARIGATPLPVPIEGSPSLVLIGDTLRLRFDRVHANQQTLQQTTVIRNGAGGIDRSQLQFYYQIENDTLTYDSCPIGVYCLASLVYAPRFFHIVGDSLFEVPIPGTGQKPRVYGRVRF